MGLPKRRLELKLHREQSLASHASARLYFIFFLFSTTTVFLLEQCLEEECQSCCRLAKLYAGGS